jgi:DNA-binding CsgD family transcriptional regulator
VAGRYAVAAVFISDPAQGAKTVPEVLRRLYGLTKAESRLVVLLLEGESIDVAARELGISAPTARTQLKSVFQKTGTGRQSDLIRLVMSGPSVLRDT